MSSIEQDRASGATLEIAVFQRAASWSVEVQDDAGGRRVTLPQARVIVGSSGRADVVVDDATVSGKHLALAVEHGGVVSRISGRRTARSSVARACARHAARRGDDRVRAVDPHAARGSRGGRGGRRGRGGEPLGGIAGGSIAMRRIGARVRRFASHSLPVLVTGETGTGKELDRARAARRRDTGAGGVRRAERGLAAERAGGERAVRTRARSVYGGRVAARGRVRGGGRGDAVPRRDRGSPARCAAEAPARARRLRGAARGGDGPGARADVRIVAATNRTLAKRVEEGEFRLDLFHRLSVFTVALPPLRERRGDIGPIARAILAGAPAGLGARRSRHGRSHGSWRATGPGTFVSYGAFCTARATGRAAES